jgi:CRP/FNR family transcriptional regulator, nitrogen fixation regulation protein
MQKVNCAFKCELLLAQGPLAVLDSIGSPICCRRNEQIYGQKDPVLYRYRLLSGAARRFVLQPNGRRQIVDFLLPGDFFGFTPRDEHVFTVEAIVDGTLAVRYARSRTDNLADCNPAVSRLVRNTTAGEITRLQARILLLGRITASEKVTEFLLEMAERLPDGPDRILLMMSRYDIADYLALSVETVSRILTNLRLRGTIALAGRRRVQIVDRSGLNGSDHEDARSIAQREFGNSRP